MSETWLPHVVVAAVIERDGKFLMVEEETSDGLRLNQPAGHLEEHESLIDAVKREVLEETAYVFQPTALVGIYRWTSPANETFMRFCFCGHAIDNTSRPLDPDILEALWLGIESIRTETLRSPLVMQCINDYLGGQRHELSLFSEL